MRSIRKMVAAAALAGACCCAWAGPYAPAAVQPGSTAIHMDDANFVTWADGYTNVVYGTHVYAKWQTPDKALGKAVGDSFDIVSLGRRGQITMTFAKPIADGSAWDFAVFENAIADGFLELGYVEVSSDGVHFFRFDNDSLTQNPVGSFGSVDPTNVTGLAGKYRQGYGTPFDLSDLDGVSPLLNVKGVTHVRILDVVGDGNYTDTDGNAIYDPYPTYESAGFDLDAVGVFHNPTPGDADLDGDVDLDDLTILGTFYNTGGHTWGQGDFDADGNVDLDDLTLLGTYYNQGGGPVPPGGPVPEPATCAVLLLGTCLVLPRRCRSRTGRAGPDQRRATES